MNRTIKFSIILIGLTFLFLMSGCEERKNSKPRIPSVSSSADQIDESIFPDKKANVRLILKTGHREKVRALALSSDEKYILSGDVYGRILLWDAAGARVIRSYEGPDDAVYTVGFSPDGKVIGVGTLESGIFFYETDTGKLISNKKGWGSIVRFSHDNRTAAVSGLEMPIMIVDYKDLKILRKLSRSKGYNTTLDYSPDGTKLACGDGNGVVKILDLNSDETVYLKGLNFWIHSVRFSPDGKKLVGASYLLRLSEKWRNLGKRDGRNGSSSGGKVDDDVEGEIDGVVDDFDKNRPPSDIPGDRSKYKGPDEDEANPANTTVAVWSTENGELLNSYVHGKGALWADFINQGRRVVSVGADNAFMYYDLVKKSRIFKKGYNNVRFLNCLAVSKDSRFVFFAGGDGIIRRYDFNEDRVTKDFKPVDVEMNTAAFSHDGKLMAAGGDDERIYIWDAENLSLKYSLPGAVRRIKTLRFLEDGKTLVSGSSSGTVFLWDLNNRHFISEFPLNNKYPVLTLDYSDAAGEIVIGDAYGGLSLWNKEENALVWHKNPIKGPILSAEFTADGGKILLAGAEKNNGMILLVDRKTGEREMDYKVNNSIVWKVKMLPDGRSFAACTGREVMIFDLESGAVLNSLKGHRGLIWAMDLSGDSKVIASAGFRGDIILSDPVSGRIMGVFPGHEEQIDSIGFQGAKRFVSVSRDNTMKIWSVNNTKASLAVMITLQGDNWIIYNEKGEFKSSPGALDYVQGAVVDDKTYSLREYREKFEKPSAFVVK